MGRGPNSDSVQMPQDETSKNAQPISLEELMMKRRKEQEEQSRVKNSKFFNSFTSNTLYFSPNS